MATTTITGPVYQINNDPLANKWIKFRLTSIGTDSVATRAIAQSVDSVQTDANGDFSIDIWDNGDSGTESLLGITVDNDPEVLVIIPTATANIKLWDLIENYQVAAVSPQLPTIADSFLLKANNLSDIPTPATANVNLGIVSGTGGGQVGTSSTATSGFAGGLSSTATTGGSAGVLAQTGSGGAVGSNTSSTDGFAGGAYSGATTGGAIGWGAGSTDGFAGGKSAVAIGAGRVQLGEGTNSTNSTIQFLSSGSVTAAEFGTLAGASASYTAAEEAKLASIPSNIAGTTTSVVATTYTALSTDSTILANNAAGVTITLLAAATAGDGFKLTIKNVGAAGSITIDGNASETIDGSLTETLTSQHDALQLVSDGSNWHII